MYMVQYELLKNICENLRSGSITHADIYDSIVESGLYQHLIQDLQNYRYYTFDGRFDDLLIESISNRIVNQKSNYSSYDEFLLEISLKMKQFIVSTVILLPLVFVNGVGESAIETIIDFSSDKFVLFPLVAKKRPFINERYSLSHHVQRTIFAKLLDKHIITVKDKNFFNYPIIAVEISDIDTRVELEAPKIVEAIYSFFRMIGLGNSTRIGWVNPSDWRPFPSTYSVYYNKVGTSPHPPYDSGYGYSFRFMFTQLLDIDFQAFLLHKKLFSDNLDEFIVATFLSSRDTGKVLFTKYKRWQNAVLLFNEAYEFASRERFDSALLLLITILESLFLKNKGGEKKEQLIIKIRAFIGNSNNEQRIFETIRSMYKRRNSFIHEGKRIERYQVYKTLHNYGGLIAGMEPPLFHNSTYDINDLKELSTLFIFCRDVLLKYVVGE